MAKEKTGMMFVLSSPSGAGKTTLTKKIAENNKNFTISISHTTRKPRPNEINGRDYKFVSEQEFNTLVKENNFFEYANIFGNYYGTLKKPVLELLSLGRDVLFDIDWQGTQQLKRIKSLSLVTFFILPPNIQVLKKRLLNRHKGQEELIEKRMNKFNEEASHWSEYNYVFINDDLDTCYKKILNVITSEKKGIRQEQNLDEIENNWPKNIPSGIIHADLFPDNIFFKDDKLTGIIDFYFSCYDFYVFEIAICLNALCFEGQKENLSFNVTKAKKFIDGYSSIKKLTEEEKKSLKILCQGAAMRFLLTRVFDYLNLTEGAIVKIKDPIEYLKRLEFHNNVKNYEDYFF